LPVIVARMNELPEIGEQIIVHGIRHAKAIVSDLNFSSQENRIVIELQWTDNSGLDIGKSRVYHYDENKIWFRAKCNS